MPKRKHTCTKNKNRKEHRNGIKRPQRGQAPKYLGGSLKLRKNDYYSKLYQNEGREAYNKKHGIEE